MENSATKIIKSKLQCSSPKWPAIQSIPWIAQNLLLFFFPYPFPYFGIWRKSNIGIWKINKVKALKNPRSKSNQDLNYTKNRKRERERERTRVFWNLFLFLFFQQRRKFSYTALSDQPKARCFRLLLLSYIVLFWDLSLSHTHIFPFLFFFFLFYLHVQLYSWD